MAEQNLQTELDTQPETLTNPESSTPEAPATDISNGESATPSDSKSKEPGNNTETEHNANPSNPDKADWKWKSMRKSIKSQANQLRRKDNEIAELKRQLEELKSSNQSASGIELIKGLNKEGRLEERIESLEQEDKDIASQQRTQYLSKLASECLKGDALTKYNSEIAPRVQATLEDLNRISPIVTRFIATSKSLPLFMNEIADMVKSGEDVAGYIKGIEEQSYNVYTGKMDPQIAFDLCREWQKELIERNSTPAAPVEPQRKKAPTTSSVNAPSSNNDGYDLEAIKRYRGC